MICFLGGFVAFSVVCVCGLVVFACGCWLRVLGVVWVDLGLLF